jgi:AI-2 transport protein TqsA
LGYLVVNIIFGSFVEPTLMGRRLGLSTLVVFVSLLFWGFVWGPIGMLFSVPLTMVMKIALDNTQEFRWVAVMLAANPSAPQAPPE